MEKIRLGDACEILNGYAFKSDNYVDSGIRVIRIANVQKGFIEDNTPAFYPLDSSGLEKYMLEEGDLLMSLTGNVGRVAILEKEFLPAALNQRVACLRLKTKRLTKGYLFHILNSDFFEQQCIQSSKGVAQKNMSTEWLKAYEIPLYPEEQQAEIASILDKTRNVIACRNQELQKLDELIKARFVEMFGDMILNPNGWKKVLLGDACDVRDGTHDSPKYFTEGYPLVTSKNVTGGKIDFTDCSLICEEDYNKINQRSKVDLGDILMPMIGTVGNPVIVDVDEEFAIKNVALIKFKENSTVINSFVKALLESDYFDRAVISKVRGGTQKFISLGDIRKLEICLPPITVQEQFSDFVKQVDKSKVVA